MNTLSSLIKLVEEATAALSIAPDFYLLSVGLSTREQPVQEAIVQIHIGGNIPKSMADMVRVLNWIKSTKNVEVLFRLEANGLEFLLDGEIEPAEIQTMWSNAMAEAQRKYEASPEYAESLRRRQREATKTQSEIDKLLASLDEVVRTPERLPKWLYDFSMLGDNINVSFDKNLVADKLVDAGYVRNEFVGLPSEEFDGVKAFRWAVGQAIDHLRRGMPIHPALGDHFIGVRRERPVLGEKPKHIS